MSIDLGGLIQKGNNMKDILIATGIVAILFIFILIYRYEDREISSSPDKKLIFQDLTLINKKLEIIKQSLSVQNKELISQNLPAQSMLIECGLLPIPVTAPPEESNKDTTSTGSLAITSAQAKFLQRGLLPIPVTAPPEESNPATGSFDISPYSPPTNLTFMCGTGKEVIKIYFDGRVEISEGVSLPEAAKMFWDAVVVSCPEFKQTIISQYEKEKKE